MDNEPGTNENESEMVESSEQINENGCSEPSEIENVNEAQPKDDVADDTTAVVDAIASITTTSTTTAADDVVVIAEPEQSNESDQKVENEEETEKQPTEPQQMEVEDECLSPKQPDPVDEPQSELDQLAVIDSDNPSECSPEKSHDIACIVSSPSEVECDEPANDKFWNQSNESSPEKSRSEVACLVSSPSEVECEESANDKSWSQLNESTGECYDDSIDDEVDSEDEDMDNEFVERSSPKVEFKERKSEQKPPTECPIFELTDDNSSVEDARSEIDDDIEGDEIGEEEEEEEDMSDYSEVHNIDDSDDEPFVEQRNVQNTRQMPTSHSAKIDTKQSNKSYDNERSFDDEEDYSKFRKHSSARSSSSQYRSYLKNVLLQKQSASRLQRYLAVKKSIKCLNKDKSTMRDSRGVNRMVEVLNSGIDTGNSSNLVSKSSPVDSSVLKERNINETNDSTKVHTATDTKESKTEDDRNRKSKRQIATDFSSDWTEEYDVYDDDEKCAKALTSEGDNDSQNALSMDVDEPSENLYVTNKTRAKYDGSGSDTKIEDDNDDPVTIESEDESSKNTEPQKSAVVVNGINKGSSSADAVDKDSKSNDHNKTTNKTNKRKISISSDEDHEPAAKHARTELDANFPKHDKMMRRMIESSTSANKNDPDNLQRDIDQLSGEIEALDDAARTKEIEWNNILYLKKMKEDMLFRLNRKKTVLEIMATKSIDNPESLFLNSNALDCLNELSANESKKSSSGGGGIGPATSFIMSRCNMKSVDLAKEKSNLNELHRNIQPKSSRSDTSTSAAAAAAAFASVVTSIPKSSPAIQAQHSFLPQRSRENGQSIFNSTGNQMDSSSHKLQIGRQGQIKDVQSIIASFRQTHPEIVPRRGRRMKNVNQGLYGNEQSGSGGDNTDALVADLLSKRNNDISSPPSSNDSTYSNSQVLLKAGLSNQFGAISAGNFKQAFNDNNIGAGLGLKSNSLLTSTPLFKNQNSGIGYPEVTLHPIGQSSHTQLLHNQKNNNDHLADAHTNSLLHGILTKSAKLKGSSTVTTGMTSSNNNAAGFNNAFSPTLARLLTAPERNFTHNLAISNNVGNNTNTNTNTNNNNNNNNNINNNNNNNNNTFFGNQAAGMNLSKSSNSRSQQDTNKPEISCLPISQILAFQQQQQQQQPQNNSLLQQQLQRYQRDINKFLPKNNVLFNLDDEADDSDRLVIDEEQYSNSDLMGGSSAKNDESHENELPECQGCKKREAQFVCADCQRQWYCSRECQVMSWDEHSEVCAR